ncbi:MAG: hypothetical protein MZV64_47575 [Ignavibacteriales bacterium]|nr:hypothetical protein [Ignavibacteriales bacterium]
MSMIRNYGEDLINRVLIHKIDLDLKIEQRVSNWEMGRIALIDKILLRMAICEIITFSRISLQKFQSMKQLKLQKNLALQEAANLLMVFLMQSYLKKKQQAD